MTTPLTPAVRFDKDLPGARLSFQPSNLDVYADDPWDIRITIGNAPLEDAYYFTVQDPQAVRRPIRELLERFALNRSRRAELDIENYPELPMLQEELHQYYEQARRGRVRLEVYVNKNPDGKALDLGQLAEPFLCSCTFADGSYDYRVLDLIFLLDPPEPSEYELRRLRDDFGQCFLLLLFDHVRRQGGETALNALLSGPAVAELREDRAAGEARCPGFAEQLKRLQRRSLLVRGDRRTDGSGQAAPLALSSDGEAEIQRLRAETTDLVTRYERYASVSLYPPALGVPNGFDLRLQLMERDGTNLMRAVMLLSLDSDAEHYFADDWLEAFESGQSFAEIHGALAFKTAFSRDLLDQVRALGQAFDEDPGV